MSSREGCNSARLKPRFLVNSEKSNSEIGHSNIAVAEEEQGRILKTESSALDSRKHHGTSPRPGDVPRIFHTMCAHLEATIWTGADTTGTNDGSACACDGKTVIDISTGDL
eukprot:scaffold33958_cov28-Tisochrysis_lutea.AAC.2